MIPSVQKQIAEVEVRGRLEAVKADLQMLLSSLSKLPLWRPSLSLKGQCSEALAILAHLENRLEGKLVVSVIGPSGAGKSTLVNALCGRDELSPTGGRRPTTRRVVILCHQRQDAVQLAQEVGPEEIDIQTRVENELLEKVTLVDTPDTDSAEQNRHVPLINRTIALSDLLLCVFNAENPKTRDHVDFLAPYVQRFSGRAVVCILNKCDRLEQQELEERIFPEFMNYLRSAWDHPVCEGLCLSARRHLHNPGWDRQALPRHDFDQFAELQASIVRAVGAGGQGMDPRCANARQLRDFVYLQTRKALEADRAILAEARTRSAAMEKEALRQALATLQTDDTRPLAGINLMLYQRLAQRWLGPVGWLVSIWSRLLIFGSGMLSLLRFGNPLRQAAGLFSALTQLRTSSRERGAGRSGQRLDTILQTYRRTVLRSWPDIAGRLIAGNFDPAVRHMETMVPESESLDTDVSEVWQTALDSALEKKARQLSSGFLQVVFNLPAIAIMAYTGGLTALRFFDGLYLTTDFFVHAFATLGFILFLCFFLLQALIRVVAGGRRIGALAWQQARRELEKSRELNANPVNDQLQTFLELEQVLESATEGVGQGRKD